LGLWPALGLGTLGLALVVLGAFATFKTDNGAGTAALLALGVVLLVVAVGRRLPREMGFGDTKVTLDDDAAAYLMQVGATATEELVADEVRPQVEAAVGEIVATTSSPSRLTATTFADYLRAYNEAKPSTQLIRDWYSQQSVTDAAANLANAARRRRERLEAGGDDRD
jgi:hypothetical protein